MNSSSKGDRPHVVVVGGGITGLAAAHALLQKQVADPLLRVTLLEATEAVGGKVQTLRADECVLELGADSFLARKEAAVRLCQVLGLDSGLVGTGPAAKQTWLTQGGELYPFPSGTYMGIPVWEAGILSSPFLSDEGKRRALDDLTLPDGSPDGDESIRTFLVRRFGEEMVDRIAEAVLSGIYGGRAEDLSLLSTFPEFRAMEREHGSVLRALQLRMADAAKKLEGVGRASDVVLSRDAGTAQGKTHSAIPVSTFLTLESGLVSLAEALDSAIRSEGGEVRLQTSAAKVILCDGGYEIVLSSGEVIQCDAVLLATPAFVTAKLLADQEIRNELSKIPYASVATVLLLYTRSMWPGFPEGSGFVVPRRENLSVTAVTWTTPKWPHSTPDDVLAIRAFVGRSEQDAIVFAEDEEILAAVRADLSLLMGDGAKTATPYKTVITRWPSAMPQYLVGHRDLVATLRTHVSERYPRMQLAGAAYEGGVGIPDCILQGEAAAAKIREALIRSR